MDFEGYYTGHRDHIDYEFRSVSTSNIPDLDLKMIHIYGYKTSPNSGNKNIFIPGKSFLAPASSQYYHTLVDIVGTYEYIKSIDNSVNIVFCAKDTNDGDGGQFFRESKNSKNMFVMQIQSLFNPSGVVYDLANDTVEFEEVVFIPTNSMWDYDRLTPLKIQQELFSFTHEDLVPIRFKYIEKLVKFFQPQLFKSEIKKVYSSRMPYKEDDPDFENFDESYFDGKDSDRLYDEREIIKYFKSQGYHIVNLSDMNLVEQFSLLSGATHLAGIDGSNMFAGVFMSPGSIVNIISTQNWWGYEFVKYLKERGLLVKELCFYESATMPKVKGLHLDPRFVLNSIINDANL